MVRSVVVAISLLLATATSPFVGDWSDSRSTVGISSSGRFIMDSSDILGKDSFNSFEGAGKVSDNGDIDGDGMLMTVYSTTNYKITGISRLTSDKHWKGTLFFSNTEKALSIHKTFDFIEQK